MTAAKELATLKALIEKSELIEVPSTRVEADQCGKPIIVNSGTMLVHKDSRRHAKEKTELLQKMAGMAREIFDLRKQLANKP